MILKQLFIRATCTYMSSAVYMVKLALSIDKLASLVQNEHFSLLNKNRKYILAKEKSFILKETENAPSVQHASSICLLHVVRLNTQRQMTVLGRTEHRSIERWSTECQITERWMTECRTTEDQMTCEHLTTENRRTEHGTTEHGTT